MPTSYGSVRVRCPFYKEETKNSLKCEGTFCESCIFAFKTTFEKEVHRDKYCIRDYENCPHYSLVDDKYK